MTIFHELECKHKLLDFSRLNVRCWIWFKSNSETICYSLEFTQILAFVSQVIDIHSSQWEFTNFGGPWGKQICPRYVDSEGFLCFCEQYTVNQDGASVCERCHFCWKIKYFVHFNIKFVSLHSVCGFEIVGKVKMIIKNTTIQDLYRKFWKNLAFVKN